MKAPAAFLGERFARELPESLEFREAPENKATVIAMPCADEHAQLYHVGRYAHAV